jgi:hypothetical protein
MDFSNRSMRASTPVADCGRRNRPTAMQCHPFVQGERQPVRGRGVAPLEAGPNSAARPDCGE